MRRAREDNALEVIVDMKLVGWLTSFCNVAIDCKEITFERVQADATFGDVSEQRPLRLFKWNRVISNWDVARAGSGWIASQVPGYATALPDVARDQTLYTWRVVKLTVDEYEWVFDHPDFEPANSKVDEEQLIEMSPEERLGQMVTAQMKAEIDRHIIKSFTGFASAINTSTQSANDSVLTMDKLNAMLKSVSMSGS